MVAVVVKREGGTVVLDVVLVLMMSLVEVAVAMGVVMAVPTLEVGQVAVLMASDGGDGNSENYRDLPAQAVYRSHFSSLQTQWLRASACPLPTHRICSGFW